jgi:hypothetical protein
LRIDGQEHKIGTETLLWSDNGAPSDWTLLQGEPAWWLALLPS